MKYLSILIVLTLLFSCGKKKERVLHLKAINPATGQVYPGLPWRVTATTTAGSGEKKVFDKEGNLDANGEATLTVKLKNSWTYNIRVVEPENTCYNKQITMHITEPEKKEQNFLFEFAPCAKFKLKVKNTSCTGPNDHFKLIFLGKEVDPSYLYGATVKEEYGCYEWESNFSDVPMGEIYYKWEVTKNGITNIFYDTVDLSEGETRIFEINY
ncbi:MAG: hypothetical protein N4A41_14620 [Crocinitomicaceae bacterium]|jgi:hypothetical protein|nr:hypothetical protein [Crocinitomicaceae bacterium]